MKLLKEVFWYIGMCSLVIIIDLMSSSNKVKVELILAVLGLITGLIITLVQFILKQKRIYPLKLTIFFAVLTTLFLSAFFIFTFICVDTIFKIISYICLALAIFFGSNFFLLPNFIRQHLDTIEIVSTSIFSMPKHKNNELLLWNSTINLNEVERIESVTLTKMEKLNLVGKNNFYKEYLKVDIKKSTRSKYVCVSMYSKKQINNISQLLLSMTEK